MAGWSKFGEFKSVSMLELSSTTNKDFKSDGIEFKGSFVELISVFLEESCSNECFRPLPPMLGNGHSVDLLKFYFIVKLKGGFKAISRKRLWDEVGVLYGLGPGIGSALKLVYLKYLDSLEAWLGKLSSESETRFRTGVWSKGVLMALESEFDCFVSNLMEEMRKSCDAYCLKEKSEISFIDLTEDEYENEKSNWNKFITSFGDDGVSTEENGDAMKLEDVEMGSTEENGDAMKLKEDVEMGFADGVCFTGENLDKESYGGVCSSDGSNDGRSSVETVAADNVVKSSENSCDSKKCLSEDEDFVMDSLLKEVSSLKRKRDDPLVGMLCWLAKVAKHPTDPGTGTVPESSKWDLYGNDNCWKQVLVARKSLFRKKRSDHSIYEKRQKMHPSMFDENEGPRFSPRLLFENLPKAPPVGPLPTKLVRSRQRLEAQIDMKPTASIYTCRPQQRIPIGEYFQVEVPEWTGVVSESDCKWLGTKIWPLENRESNLLVESDPIGKGRLDSCGCLFPGSSECVKFHVSKRRMIMKFELASVFYTWKFDKMGEECSVSWTAEEEKNFKTVVKENPLSHQKSFWTQLCEVLPKKNWVDLVNYYFNVFVLRRRGFQNRYTPWNIDSDDDESEYGSAINTLGHNTTFQR